MQESIGDAPDDQVPAAERRRARFLRHAEEAQKLARLASDEETRHTCVEIALLWLTLSEAEGSGHES
jgi:hypothetical protein